MPTVAFSRRDEQWVVLGAPRREGAQGELVLVPEDLPLVKAVDLRDALVAHRDYLGAGYARREGAHVTELPGPYDDEEALLSAVDFELVGSQLLVSTTCFVPWPDDGHENKALESVTRLVTPLLARSGSTLEDVRANDTWSDQFNVAVMLSIRTPWRGRSAADLFQIGQEAFELCEAFAAGDVNRQTVGDLVRGGGANLLIGQEEGNWLDAKVGEYDLTTTRGRISLAQTVSRFANAEDGGLIVIGARAKKIPGGEVIREVRGVAPGQKDTAARYMRVLNQYLYPPAYAVRIDLVPTTDDRVLIVIDVPPQPEELKPFLVHGAITTDGDIEGTFISIVRRRGEGSIPITAPMIHASIAAGRALLRGHTPNSHDA